MSSVSFSADSPPPRRRRTRLAMLPPLAATTALLVCGLAPAAQAAPGSAVGHTASGIAPAAKADLPDSLAEYLFADGERAKVPNTAASPEGLGDAEVKNGGAQTWTDTSLQLTGGAKDGDGTWVQLPKDLLKERSSVSVTTEVKVDAAMRNDFNFLWNVGGENTDEYFFTTAKDAPRTAITVGSNGGEKSATSSSNLDTGHWTSLTSVLDAEAKTLTFYVDGEKTGSVKTDLTPADIKDQSLNTIGRSPWPDQLFKGEVSAFRVYPTALNEEQVQQENLADAQINAEALESEADDRLEGLELPSGDVTGDHVSLPSSGGKVTWTSSDPDVIATDGSVTQPERGADPVDVTLTAKTTVRGLSAERTTQVRVLPSDLDDQARLATAAGNYVLPTTVVSGDKLPEAPEGLTVTSLEADGAELKDGALVAAGEKPVTATVAATIARSASPETTISKQFTVTVLPSGSDRLAAYHRTPTTESEANNADVALSMHLAFQADDSGSAWSPLNENYGIFFPHLSEAVPDDGVDLSLIRSLKNPTLFELADGGYGVVGTRVARGGGADGTQQDSVLVATSHDLLSYDELGLLELDESDGVNRPTAVYDSAAKTYRISWTTDSGAQRHQDVEDLAAATSGTDADGSKAATAAGSSGAGRATGTTEVDDLDIEDFAAGNTLPVSADVAEGLQTRFGRITNTGVQDLGSKQVDKGAALTGSDLPQQATLDYSDGSTRDLPVQDWDLSDVDTSKAGTYTAKGRIKQTDYPKPFAVERADPSAYKFDLNGETKYLMIATNDPDMDNVGQKGKAFMPVRMADSLSGLADEAEPEEVHLLDRGDKDADGKTMTGCFWAPEFHEIAGKLSILFMPCYGDNPGYMSGRASIMQLKQDDSGDDLDPTVAANWTTPKTITRTDGTSLNDVSGISLDMTYFQDQSGQSYYAWQQMCHTFIAKMDPADPGKLTSDPVRIVAPEYAWDNSCAEGPNVHERDGKLYLIYSGSGVGNTYTTGLATAPATGADLTDPESWTKLNYPLQKSGKFEGEWQLGTGHGMWTEDEDGALIYVFHARTDVGGSGRDMFVRRVHFASDGMPIMDMEASEELSSPTVSMKIVVADDADAGADPTSPSDSDSDSGSGSDSDSDSDASADADSGSGAGAGSDGNGSGTPTDPAGPSSGAGSDSGIAAGSDSDSDVTGTDDAGAAGSGADSSDSATSGTADGHSGLAATGVQAGLVALAGLGAALLVIGFVLARRRRHG
ncbi:MAG: family 43 glycosylhydrolase [Galactobacter sp.]